MNIRHLARLMEFLNILFNCFIGYDPVISRNILLLCQMFIDILVYAVQTMKMKSLCASRILTTQASIHQWYLSGLLIHSSGKTWRGIF